jgi:hypothetical protein
MPTITLISELDLDELGELLSVNEELPYVFI